ncbi:MAG: sec-independent translocase [Actinobacteria bacterium]|jgi:sec-independent protein translocase protein TatB|nr:sec-independent translocase [Actinomycetota bacterium]
MFNIGGGEIIGLLVLGMILIGPDRMPSVAADAAKFLIKLKNIAQNATNELKENLGPGYEDLQVKDLHPKAFIKKHIGDVIDKSDFDMKPKPKIDPDLL